MAERTAMERLCPRCQSRLLRLARRAIAVDGCTGCGGVWFDAHELEQLRRQHRGALAFLDKALKPPQKVDLSSAPTPLCPVCRIPLVSFAFQNVPHVTLDGCRQCRGLWTDHGELTQLQAAVRTATAPARPTGGSPCPNCGATNYSTDPACLSCGANLVRPPATSVPTPVIPGVAPSAPGVTPGADDEEFLYGAIGAGVFLALDLVFGRRSAAALVESVLIGALIGVLIARYRSWRRRRSAPGRGITHGVRSFVRDGVPGVRRFMRDMGPGMLWAIATFYLGMASIVQASERRDESDLIWLVLFVLLLPVGAALSWLLRVETYIEILRGDRPEPGGPEQRRVGLAVLGAAFVLELLMFLAWPANARINLIAVLLTAATMSYYFFKRDLWTD